MRLCAGYFARLAHLLLVFAAAPGLASGEEMRGELGVNVYGLDNEVNPGLGLRYRFAREDPEFSFWPRAF